MIRISTFISLEPPNRCDLAFFHGTQKLCLQRVWHVSNFIKKQSASICKFEKTFFVLSGIGKGTLLMPEEFAFDECFGDCCAVYRHKRQFIAIAGKMDNAREDLFPGSVLSGDQHVGIGVPWLHGWPFRSLFECFG